MICSFFLLPAMPQWPSLNKYLCTTVGFKVCLPSNIVLLLCISLHISQVVTCSFTLHFFAYFASCNFDGDWPCVVHEDQPVMRRPLPAGAHCLSCPSAEGEPRIPGDSMPFVASRHGSLPEWVPGRSSTVVQESPQRAGAHLSFLGWAEPCSLR